jgi:ABC-type sugar transport system substrate-binding protein
MKKIGKVFSVLGCVTLVALTSSFAQGKKTVKIALIAKSSTNPVFLSARTGAEAAAK